MPPSLAANPGIRAKGRPPGAPSRETRHAPHYIAVAVLCFVLLLSAGFGRDGDTSDLLRGPDDFMRVVQIADWLDGQGWRDTVQRRLNPPEGVDMHWSRLADLPLAGATSLAEPWFGRARAIHLAGLTVPPLLGALLAAAFLWGAAALLPDRRTSLPVAMVATLIYPFLYVLPGRVDHHGLQLLLTAFAMGCLFRALEPSDLRPAAGLGLAGGVSLAVGLETLPFVGTASVVLSLAWAWRRAPASTLTCFGAALTATSVALLLLTLPMSSWTTAACDRMSLVHVTLNATVLAAGASALALERLRPGASWPLRLVTVGCVGIVGVALAAAVFPQCAGGPYGGVADEARYWLGRVSEAQSLADLFDRRPGSAVSAAVMPAVALGALGWQWTRASERSSPYRFALVVLVISGLAVAAWQIRGVAHAGLAASFALVPLAAADSRRARVSGRIAARLGPRVWVPLACVSAIFAPLLLQLGQDTGGGDAGCDVTAVLDALNDPAGLGGAARTVAAPIDVGPALLFLTRHRVLAGPYHRNVRGLADNRRIFAGTEAEARATITSRGVEAILFCRKYADKSNYAGRPAFLDGRLASDRPPGWLVPVARAEGIALYRVDPNAAAAR